MTINDTLAERGSRYGKFEDHAKIAIGIKQVMRYGHAGSANSACRIGWVKMAPDQQQALDTIADKIARILNGDPDYIDNWHDIQGYAKLVEDRLVKDQTNESA